MMRCPEASTVIVLEESERGALQVALSEVVGMLDKFASMSDDTTADGYTKLVECTDTLRSLLDTIRA